MKLTYKMTADEFYKGYNYKIQKIGLNNMAEIVSLVVIMIASIIVSNINPPHNTIFIISYSISVHYRYIGQKDRIVTIVQYFCSFEKRLISYPIQIYTRKMKLVLFLFS